MSASVSTSEQPRAPRRCREELRCGEWVASKGRPCVAPRANGMDRCLWHSPGLSEVRRAASAKGGRAFRRTVALPELLRCNLSTQDGFERLVRGVLQAVLMRQITSASARFVVAQAERLYAAQAQPAASQNGLAEDLRQLIQSDRHSVESNEALERGESASN